MATKKTTYAVGIDLGTTYSCISYLTPQGQPQTLPNTEGELSTPSVVFIDGSETIVGTEALRNSVTHPEQVISHAKRFIGDPNKCWVIGGKVYNPVDVSSAIVRKLLDGAQEFLGVPVTRAVITVPAQFSEIQRQQTVEAGRKAGLTHVDIINEPVAAALCHVLSEGMWFAELANEQTIMVFDLGGGTFDLSLVKYNKNEVRVKASGGDLHLGGLDWNLALEKYICDQFASETGLDPRLDRESLQAVTLEVEQVKRALSVRPKASVMVQHAGRRKTYGLDRHRFEELTRQLVQRTQDITLGMLKANKLGWAHVDTVLVTGGASRMPMVRDMLKRVSGTTLNTSLSPDQSICHGAAYYAGMLLSGQSLEKSSLNKEATAKLSQMKQQSVNARGLGILVRDMESQRRVPHFLIPANSPLPIAFRQRFGTVVPNQKRVHLHIVESGTSDTDPPVELGACVVDDFPSRLPVGSPIEVTIRYDEQARVHVEARELVSGKSARTTIVRKENVTQGFTEEGASADLVSAEADVAAPKVRTAGPSQSGTQQPSVPPAARATKASTFVPHPSGKPAETPPSTPRKQPTPNRPAGPAKAAEQPRRAAAPPRVKMTIPLEEADRPIPLCNHCGEPLDTRGRCPACLPGATQRKSRPQAGTAASSQPRKTRKRPPGN